MSKLEFRDVSRIYGGFKAVEQLSLRIAEGEFVSLLGPSGCGKTTTLRMIAGFVPLTGGAILQDGAVISSPDKIVPPEKRGMSMIFQSYAIWPNMTVAENVAFGLDVRKVPSAERRSRVEEMLRIVRLDHLADRYPAELSGGQQQRVALARALVIKPGVLLLDEPLSNLDANLREEMRSEIRRLHDEFKITTIYVTHDQSEAMATSDRIAVMNSGRLEQIEKPQLLYRTPRTRFVAGFIGRANFLKGTVQDDHLVLAGVAIPLGRLGFDPRQGTGEFMLRPQNVHMTRERPAEALAIEGVVTRSTYLGEYWDYQIRLANGDILNATLPPHCVFAAEDKVWVRLVEDEIVMLAA